GVLRHGVRVKYRLGAGGYVIFSHCPRVPSSRSMTPSLFTALFLAALAVSIGLQLWLAARQRRYVLGHRDAVPAHFDTRINLAAHRKAADYTAARGRLAVVEIILDTIVLLALTLGGGLAWLAQLTATLPFAPLFRDVALVVLVALIAGA